MSADPEEASVKSKDEDKPGKAKKQKQRGCYAPQRLLTAVCKLAPHFKVPTVLSGPQMCLVTHSPVCMLTSVLVEPAPAPFCSL